MIKFPNLLKAAGIMLGLVWGLYGNQSVIKAVPEVWFADPYEEVAAVAVPVKPAQFATVTTKGDSEAPNGHDRPDQGSVEIRDAFRPP